MNAKQTTLANGVRVITSTMPSVESVALGIWVGVGARYETQGTSGISHFIEHLLFKGTRSRSARDISQEIEGRGGYLNAFTQEENTCYYARVAYDHQDSALDVLTDMVRRPKLDPVEINKERGVILEEIMMYRDQPQHVVQEMLTAALWPGHPLGRPVIGSPVSLTKQDRSVIRAFRAEHYVPGNMVVSLAGRVEHEACVKQVRGLFGAARGKAGRAYRRVTPSVKQTQCDLQSKDIEQTHVAMGFRVFGHHDSRRYALRILNAVLGENMSSRLFQVVRERHGLAYSVQSGVHLYTDTGVLEISAGLERKRSVKAVELILKEVARMTARPMGRAELQRAKDYSIGQLRLGLERPASQMLWLGDNLMSYDRFIPPDEVVDKLRRVTASDVQTLAGSVFRARHVSMAMLTPGLTDREASRIRALLRAI